MSTTLSPRLHAILQKHLRSEEEMLLRIQELATGLTDGGFNVTQLVERQAGLSSLLAEMLDLQLQRQHLCLAISQSWGCEQHAVRLSRAQLETDAATHDFQEQREKMMQLSLGARTSLRTAEKALKGWSGIVNYVLGELLDSTGTPDRYGANGQRLACTRIGSVDMRS